MIKPGDIETLMLLINRYGRDELEAKIKELAKRKRGAKKQNDNSISVWVAVRLQQEYAQTNSRPKSDRVTIDHILRHLPNSSAKSKTMRNTVSEVEHRRATDPKFKLQSDFILNEARKIAAMPPACADDPNIVGIDKISTVPLRLKRPKNSE